MLILFAALPFFESVYAQTGGISRTSTGLIHSADFNDWSGWSWQPYGSGIYSFSGGAIYLSASGVCFPWYLGRIRYGALSYSSYVVRFRSSPTQSGDATMVIAASDSNGPWHPGAGGFQPFSGTYYWMVWWQNYYGSPWNSVLIYWNSGSGGVTGPSVAMNQWYTTTISVAGNTFDVKLGPWDAATWQSGPYTFSNPSSYYLWLLAGGGCSPGGGWVDWIQVYKSKNVVVTGLSAGQKIELYKSDGTLLGSYTVPTGQTTASINLADQVQKFPASAYFKLYSPSGSLIYTSPTFNDMWPGDEYKYEITQYQLTVQTSGLPVGSVLKINGAIVATNLKDGNPYQGWFNTGSTVSVEITTPVSGGSGTRYVFTQWSGDASGSNNPLSITMDSAKTVTANYKTQYQLTVESDPITSLNVYIDGSSTPNGQTTYTTWLDSGSHTIKMDTQVISGGYVWLFDHWSNGASGSDMPLSINLNNPLTIRANYVKQLYTIFVQLKDQAGADIKASGIKFFISYGPTNAYITTDSNGKTSKSGIEKNFVVTLQCLNTTFPYGSNTRYVFTGWSGYATGSNPTITFTMPGNNVTFYANFKLQYYLTVKTSPEGLELPSDNGGGWYDAGSQAIAKCNENILSGLGTRNHFKEWGGDASGSSTTSNPILMNGPKTAIANYKLQRLLSVTAAGLTGEPGGAPVTTRLVVDDVYVGDIPPSWEKWYDNGTIVKLRVESVPQHAFKYWELDGIPQSQDPLPVEMFAPRSAIAVFESTRRPLLTFPLYSPIAPAFSMAVSIIFLFIKRLKKLFK
jgi:uncharacterized repeat protein (TIGR02543 family)